MKFEFDKKYIKICLYAFATLAALLLFNRILQASSNIWQSFINAVAFLLELLSPFIIAIVLAYILNPAVIGINMLLGKIFKQDKFIKGRKLISLGLVYVATIAVLVLTLSFVIPGIIRNIGELIKNLPGYYEIVKKFYLNDFLTYPLLTNDAVQNAISTQMAHFTANLSQYMGNTISGITGFMVHFVSSVASAIIGLVLSFYLLNEREVIMISFGRLLHARLGDKRSSAVMSFLGEVDKVFGRYISAKLLVVIIMFAICFSVFGFMGVRYAVLMSAIVAITTLVPYIGPFLGAMPPIIISLLESPQKAIYVGISILVIHAVDGYFIEPYIFSDKMGLSPFWILLSVILGGGLFGLWGLLLAVPAAAVVKLLISKYIRSRQIRHRREQGEAGLGK
jgi:predicted PurR-regulated permease PerM